MRITIQDSTCCLLNDVMARCFFFASLVVEKCGFYMRKLREFVGRFLSLLGKRLAKHETKLLMVLLFDFNNRYSL